ncbi:MAG: UDP-N-acetylmuramoyl-tripeptide--D-alanyl-D-alanine ligase [Pseudomonadota bacterium]
MTAPLWTSAEMEEATGGRALRPFGVSGISIDTRTLQKGDLFVALSDARDGHDFVADALAKGAGGALVNHLPPGVKKSAPLVVVTDVFKALQALAVAARARTDARIVAVTGSVGKTGTKDMLHTMLAAQGRTHSAAASFNNHWGVPITLARMPRGTEFAVIEIGMNAPGEIAPLARMARPHVALITTVAPVHIEAFDDLAGIAREKASIVEGLEPGGVAVLNRDTSTIAIQRRRARRAGARIVTFGSAGRPAFRLEEAQITPGATLVEARAHGNSMLFRIGAPGRHLALNALGALAAVEALGADIGKAALALSQWKSPDGRGARWVLGLGEGGIDGSVLLIDDAFNASPTSVEVSLAGLAATNPKDGIGRVSKGRRIVFLTDMLELGRHARAMHEGLAELPAWSSIDKVHAAGPMMQHLHAALPPGIRGKWFKTPQDMAAQAGRLIDAGDVVLVKGSKGSKASLTVTALKKLGAARPANQPDDGDD